MELWKNINNGKPESSEEIKNKRLKILLDILDTYSEIKDYILSIIENGQNLAEVLYSIYLNTLSTTSPFVSQTKAWDLYQSYVWCFLGLYVGKADENFIAANYGLIDKEPNLINTSKNIPDYVGNNFIFQEIQINYSGLLEDLKSHLNGFSR